MRFPDSFIEDVKSRVVLSDVIGRRHKVVKSGKSLKVCCPFHAEKTPSCYLYDGDGHYHCFGCGAHGDVFEYLMTYEKLSFYEAVVHLAQASGLNLPKVEEESPAKAQEKTRHATLLHVMEAVTQWYEAQLFSPKGREARHYLQSRGFSDQTVHQFRVGVAPSGNALLREFHHTRGVSLKDLEDVGLVITDSERGETYDRFRGRLMFPIMTKKGHIVGFGGRHLGAAQGPKYLNSPETLLFHKGAELYGHHFACRREAREQPVLVCEGYTDVMSLHQAGYTRAVAPLGTALTPTQIQLLWRLSRSPILCFDGDVAGAGAAIRAARTALPILSPDKTLQFLSLPEGEDPASLLEKGGRPRFEKLIETKCRPVVEVLWQSCLPKVPPKTPEERVKIKKQISSLSYEIRDKDLQESYYTALQDLYVAYLQKCSQKNPASRGRPRASFGRLGSYRPPSPLERPALDAAYMREAILLYALLNFPVLIRDYEEEIAHFKGPSAVLQKLKGTLLMQINENPDLDRETLRGHLCEGEFKNLVEEILGPKISLHASFAHPDRPLEEVRLSFQRYVKGDYGEVLALDDMRSQAENFASHMSAQEWDKIRHRRKLMAVAVSEAQNQLNDEKSF